MTSPAPELEQVARDTARQIWGYEPVQEGDDKRALDRDVAIILAALTTAVEARDARIVELDQECRLGMEEITNLRTDLEAEATTVERLTKALTELYEFAATEGDFRNGVTDSTGTIDEGNVRASGYFDRARAALQPAEAKETT